MGKNEKCATKGSLQKVVKHLLWTSNVTHNIKARIVMRKEREKNNHPKLFIFPFCVSLRKAVEY